jgi:photosystem II stability/assembly factor-like uncharacterized protein
VVVALVALVWAPLQAEAAAAWRRQTSGTEVHLHGIFAFDGCHVWAVGEETGDQTGQSVIVATTDGGRHWASQTFPVGSAQATTMNRVLFTDALKGYAAGENNNTGSGEAGKPNFLRTSDGGATWVDVSANLRPKTNAGQYNDIEGLSAVGNDVWITVSSAGNGPNATGTISHSPDRGNTWVVQRSYSNESFDSVSMASDGLHGWATSNDKKLWRTNDGGTHWNIVSATAQTAEQVYAVTAQSAVIAEDNGVIEYTTNGTSLSSATLPSQAGTKDLTDIAMGTNGRGYATGELGGSLLITNDGGVTWSAQSAQIPDQVNLNGVTITRDGNNSAWVTGENGGIAINKLAASACP